MANNTGWIAGRGQGLTYGTAGFTAANFNSGAIGAVIVAATAIANSTALDQYANISYSIVNGTTTTIANNFLSLYVLPLNQDGSTYGDGTATAAASPPGSTYWAANSLIRIGVASGGAMVGTFTGIVLPPNNFKFAIVNNGQIMGTSAAAAVNYITYNESLNS